MQNFCETKCLLIQQGIGTNPYCYRIILALYITVHTWVSKWHGALQLMQVHGGTIDSIVSTAISRPGQLCCAACVIDVKHVYINKQILIMIDHNLQQRYIVLQTRLYLTRYVISCTFDFLQTEMSALWSNMTSA